MKNDCEYNNDGKCDHNDAILKDSDGWVACDYRTCPKKNNNK